MRPRAENPRGVPEVPRLVTRAPLSASLLQLGGGGREERLALAQVGNLDVGLLLCSVPHTGTASEGSGRLLM